MSAAKKHDGWELHESGPTDADHAVLLLPGALCSAVFFEDLIKEPRLRGASIRLVATALPGFGRTEHRLSTTSASKLRHPRRHACVELGCDLVVGHSVGANVGIEMAAAGEFRGRLLLSPTFSARTAQPSCACSIPSAACSGTCRSP